MLIADANRVEHILDVFKAVDRGHIVERRGQPELLELLVEQVASGVDIRLAIQSPEVAPDMVAAHCWS